MQTAGIIGGSGFIGSYITRLFLKNGYRAKVSTTNISDKSRYGHLFSLPSADNLEMVALDLLNPAGIKDFASCCDIIVHGGTPFKLDVQNPQTELFEPTVTGTRNFLSGLKEVNGVKKVIFIASVAAWNTSFPLNPAPYSPGHIFSEKDTPYYSETDHPYAQAKFLADQAVREFLGNNDNLPFEIVSVSPVFVIGNALSSRQDSTSMGLQYLFKNNIRPNEFVEFLFTADIPFALVDVHDVATAIFSAATKNGLHGKNYLLAADTYRVSDIAHILNKRSPQSAATTTYDSSLARNDLDISFKPSIQTLNDIV